MSFQSKPCLRRFVSLSLLLLFALGCESSIKPISETDQSPPSPPITVLSAESWNSQPDPFPASYEHEPRIVLIHHAGVHWKDDDDPVKKLQGLQAWGKRDRGWADVPYHFLIAPDGRIFEGRDMKYKPDTNTNFDTTGYINVQLWGHLDEQPLPDAQLEATVRLTAQLAEQLNMPTDQIVTHRDVAPGQTSCPGDHFYIHFASGNFQQWVTQARNGQPFTLN